MPLIITGSLKSLRVQQTNDYYVLIRASHLTSGSSGTFFIFYYLFRFLPYCDFLSGIKLLRAYTVYLRPCPCCRYMLPSIQVLFVAAKQKKKLNKNDYFCRLE